MSEQVNDGHPSDKQANNERTGCERMGNAQAAHDRADSVQVNGRADNVMDVADVVAWEKEIAASGTPLAELMARAGQAVASYANDLLFEDDPLQSFNDKFLIENIVGQRKTAKKIVVLCGSGNNGGDGWVAAQELGDQGYNVTLVSKVPASELTAEPARTNALAADASSKFEVVIDPDAEDLAALLNSADLIIDAILGTGFAHDTVREPYNEWIKLANAAREGGSAGDAHEGGDESDLRKDRTAKILAVDCPSGLNAQTGKPARVCIEADLTVTMLAVKTGLIQPAVAPYIGDLELAALLDLESLV